MFSEGSFVHNHLAVEEHQEVRWLVAGLHPHLIGVTPSAFHNGHNIFGLERCSTLQKNKINCELRKGVCC